MQIIYEYVTYRVQKCIYIQWAEEYTFPLGPAPGFSLGPGNIYFPWDPCEFVQFLFFSMGYDVRITKKIVRKN